MNIHITCTPEFSEDKLDEIIALLSSISGELKFFKGRLLSPSRFNRLNSKIEDISTVQSLTFEEYFDIIQGYRELMEISECDFVIIISSIRNTKRWFSAFNGRNIFVHGVEWDLITDVDSIYGIAYQCVENIFQSLIDLNIDDISAEPNIHKFAIGCINDYCEYKPDILKKLQAATICKSCYERAVSKGVNDFITAHIVEIIERVRKEFVISRMFSRQAQLSKIKIDNKGDITIGDKPISLEIIPKVMYIGFLKNISGFTFDQLCPSLHQFEKIYKILRKNPDEYSIRKMCCKTIKYGNTVERIKPTFQTNRTRIKNALKSELSTILTNYYHINLVEINHKKELYKVNLAKDFIDIAPRFL